MPIDAKPPVFRDGTQPPSFVYTEHTHKYLLAREGGQTPSQNKQELKLRTLTMSIGDDRILYNSNSFKLDDVRNVSRSFAEKGQCVSPVREANMM